MEVNPSLDLKMAKRLTYDNLVVTIYLDGYFNTDDNKEKIRKLSTSYRHG